MRPDRDDSMQAFNTRPARAGSTVHPAAQHPPLPILAIPSRSGQAPFQRCGCQCKKGHCDHGASLPGTHLLMRARALQLPSRLFGHRVWRALLASVLALGLSAAAAAAVFGGKVVAVTDGDRQSMW